jgi:hypothetical protein
VRWSRCEARIDRVGVVLIGPHEGADGKKASRFVLYRGRSTVFLDVTFEEVDVVGPREWRVGTRGHAAAAILQALVAEVLIAKAGADFPVLARLVLVTDGRAPIVVLEPADRAAEPERG